MGSRRIALLSAVLLALAMPTYAQAPPSEEPAAQAPAEADEEDEVADRLAQCQSAQLTSEARLGHCTWIIDNETLEDDIRAEALLNRGIVHLNEGKADLALPDLDKAIALNPRYPAPYAYRAEAHEAKGNRDQAIADYTRAIELDQTSADLFADRGDTFRKMGQPDKAKADFEAALAIDKDHAGAREGLKALGGGQ